MSDKHAHRPATDRSMPIRVAIIDDEPIVGVGLTAYLRPHEVVWSGNRVEDFLDSGLGCDIVLLDLHLASPFAGDVCMGPEAVRRLASTAGIVLYTGEARPPVLLACLGAGASGFVHKAEPLARVREMVERVACGEVILTTALAGVAEYLDHTRVLPALSPRQREVLGARARGERYRSIARRMYITEKTAEEYMSEVGRKFAEYLQEHSPADLERWLGLGPGDLLDWRK